jgi:hypothetical protein
LTPRFPFRSRRSLLTPPTLVTVLVSENISIKQQRGLLVNPCRSFNSLFTAYPS